MCLCDGEVEKFNCLLNDVCRISQIICVLKTDVTDDTWKYLYIFQHVNRIYAHASASHTRCTACRQRPGENIRLVDILCVCVCVSWRIKLGIIETHDSIPYKLLDKGLRFFFIHPYAHIPLPPFFLKASFDFDPNTSPRETSLSESVPISLSCSLLPPPPLLHPLFFYPSSPPLLMSNCWLSPAVLQSAWKHTHGGEEIYPPRTKKAGKRGNCLFQLLCHFLSYSVIWIFPSSHSGSTSTSGFISASRCFLWQPNSSSFAPVEAPVIWTVDNSPQTFAPANGLKR